MLHRERDFVGQSSIPSDIERSTQTAQQRDKATLESLRVYLAYVAAEERKGRYGINNNLEAYIRILGGLQNFCGYVRDNTKNAHLLDIGAGEAKGINELATSSLGRNLRFSATGLVAPNSTDVHAGRVPYIVTSGEFLEGVEAPIGGILAVYSITYSPAPQMVADSIDDILEPGGVMKAALIPQHRFGPRGLTVATLSSFDPLFREKSYDIASYENGSSAIFLVKKPGGASSISAQELLRRDLAVQRR